MKSMKSGLLLLVILLSTTASAQSANPCKAFEEGCWTLIGANNGVEHYVTHKRYARPGSTETFTLVVYSKLVNTNDYAVAPTYSYSAAKCYFYFKETNGSGMSLKEIEMGDGLEARETRVRTSVVVTNMNEVVYSRIEGFRYRKP
jgi:hypothetical protein